MESMLSLSLKDFGKTVGSDSFAPGGGCVSALAGGLSASLAKMVLLLTIGKKKYVEFDVENKAVLESVEKHAEAMMHCVDRDAAGCAVILEALALPKNTESEKNRRKNAVSDASKKANEAPIEVCDRTLAMLRIFKNSISKINRNTITDWAVGAMQAYAGLEGASMNAKINCASIEDVRYKKELEEKFRSMLGEGREIIGEIRDQIHSCLDSSN